MSQPVPREAPNLTKHSSKNMQYKITWNIKISIIDLQLANLYINIIFIIYKNFQLDNKIKNYVLDSISIK